MNKISSKFNDIFVAHYFSATHEKWFSRDLMGQIIISPVSEGSGDVMVLRRSRPPPAARNGVNAITKKPRDGLFSNFVYTLVVIVSWPD